MAAQQLVHRDAVGLARDVPQCLVDAGQGAVAHDAAAVEAALGERLPVLLDPGRVLPHEVVEHLLDAAGDGVRLALDDGLAPARDALVGVEAEEEPARFHEEEFVTSDLHLGASTAAGPSASSSGSSCPSPGRSSPPA
jgi:hypothetical protein